MKTKALFLATAALVVAPVAAKATDVELKGAHLCCGQCTKAVANTLKRVEGVSDAACDRDAKTIKFKATDAKVARQAVRQLRRAGFGGTLSIDGKAIKPRKRKSKSRKADKVVLVTHICCGGCLKTLTKAAKSVEGVESVDRNKNRLTVNGKQFDVRAVLIAIGKEGFAARPAGRKKKKKKN